MILIGKGAEANLYLRDWYGRKVIQKVRIAKRYRVRKIDLKIREYRTMHEAQMMHDAKYAGVSTPIIYQVDRKRCFIIMGYIDGKRLKEAFQNIPRKERSSICRTIGRHISALHDRGIIHGDLTTSNLIMTTDDKIYFIDFGLSYYSRETEDKGVDLHLIKRALNSSHYEFAEEAFSEIKRGYEDGAGEEDSKIVYGKIEEIERRGRYFSKDLKRSRSRISGAISQKEVPS